MRLLAILVFGAILMCGCATYQPTQGESTAKLRFVTYTSENSSLTVQDPQACPNRHSLVFQQMSWLFPHTPTRVGVAGAPDAESSAYEETYIPAGGKALIIVGSNRAAVQYVPGYDCKVGLVFDVLPNAEYEVQYRHTDGRCYARLDLLSVEDGKIKSRLPVLSLRTFRSSIADNLCGHL